MSKLQEKASALKREHLAPQNIEFLYFFLFLWVRFALLDPGLDPDSATQINADWTLDPDPKPCIKEH